MLKLNNAKNEMSLYSQIETILGCNHVYLSEIKRIREYVLLISFETFYEPVSLVDCSGKKRKVINLTPELVNAWLRHVCYSSTVRMLNFEQGILSELGAHRLITSMALLRSHMEAGGMACLCLEEIRKWLETGDSSLVAELIPQTFLGTSMVRAKKKNKVLEEMLFPSEHDKVPIGRIISALDDFISCGNPGGSSHGMYGLLCEYTHPNLRAMRDHIDANDHDVNGSVEGWFHSYRIDAQLVEKHYLMALRALMSSMKAGHAACDMLRHTRFGFEGTKGYVQSIDEEAIREIWDTFLSWPEGAE